MLKIRFCVINIFLIFILSIFPGCITSREAYRKNTSHQNLPVSTIEGIPIDPADSIGPVIQSPEHSNEKKEEPSWSQIISGIKKIVIEDYSTIRPCLKAGLTKKQYKEWVVYILKEKLRKYHGYAISLLLLMLLWSIVRYLRTVQTVKKLDLTKEEIGLLKIIKVNAVQLWENHRPKKKVVRIKDYLG
ncbi:MAG: hypothetical protein JW882_13440 [Deltaproteobacteria bacterium]|nr:hypothetical protein [Deltaproteobacteria bacterium]